MKDNKISLILLAVLILVILFLGIFMLNNKRISNQEQNTIINK